MASLSRHLVVSETVSRYVVSRNPESFQELRAPS